VSCRSLDDDETILSQPAIDKAIEGRRPQYTGIATLKTQLFPEN
jgi:hypothetical protein